MLDTRESNPEEENLQAITVPSSPGETPAFFGRVRLQSALIFAVAFLLYGNSLTHGFVLDDNAMIAQNNFTKKGVAGLSKIFTSDMFFGYSQSETAKELVTGGRYRPLSQAMFAVIYQFFGALPFPYHLVTVLFFAFTCVVLYRSALLLFGPAGYGPLLAWMASLLFVVHPIHTEVVNNIKSCDEILVLLFSLLTLNLSIRAFRQNSMPLAMAAGGVFLLASFSKENSVAFTALIPLALWMLWLRDREPGSETPVPWSQIVKICLPAWVAFIAFFIVRGTVLNWTFGTEQLNVINNPFVKFTGEKWVFFTAGEKLATVLYTLGKYIQLLFFPHPLTTDYYPRHIPIMAFSDWTVWLSLVVNTALLGYALWGFRKGKLDIIRFGVLVYFATLFIVSNLLFPTGVNMAERFMFMPSVGFSLAIAGLVGVALTKGYGQPRHWLILFSAICLAMAARTFVRNFDFSDSRTLLFADIQVSENSAKLQCTVGSILLREATEIQNPDAMRIQIEEAIAHFDRALDIHPTYTEALFARGTAYYFIGNYEAAIQDLGKCAMISPDRPQLMNNLAAALFERGKELVISGANAQTAFQYLSYSNQMVPNTPETLYYLGLACSATGNYQDAIRWLSLLMSLQPSNTDGLRALAHSYALAGNKAKSDEINNKLKYAGQQ